MADQLENSIWNWGLEKLDGCFQSVPRRSQGLTSWGSFLGGHFRDPHSEDAVSCGIKTRQARDSTEKEREGAGKNEPSKSLEMP